MHRCEFLLRDFINVEKHCLRCSLIILHDCVPVDADTATREPKPAAVSHPAHKDWWLGDVWRTALLLKRRRRDLAITVLDAYPSGLVCISGLNQTTQMIADVYIEEMMAWSLDAIGIDGLHKELGVRSTGTIASLAQITELFVV